MAEPGGAGRVCLGRLDALQPMELARQEYPGTWKLADGWLDVLREMGERKDITERLLRIVGDRALRQRVIDRRNTTRAFDRVIAGMGLEDQLAGTMFVAVMSECWRGFAPGTVLRSRQRQRLWLVALHEGRDRMLA